MFCRYCGTPNDDNAVQCVKCNSILKTQPATVSAPLDSAGTSADNLDFQATPYQQPDMPYIPNQSPYPYQSAPDNTVPLKKYPKALPVIALILSILSVNTVGLILSIIAMTRSGKYKKAALYGMNTDANSAAKSSKVLSIIAIILSILTIASIAAMIPYAIRYTNLGLYF